MPLTHAYIFNQYLEPGHCVLDIKWGRNKTVLGQKDPEPQGGEGAGVEGLQSTEGVKKEEWHVKRGMG